MSNTNDAPLPQPEIAPVLAFDPSVVNLGYAVVSGPKPARIASGTWHPSKAGGERFDQLARAVRDLVAVHRPQAVVVEVPSGGQRGQRSALQLMIYARAIGVVEGVAALQGIPAKRVTVNAWKGSSTKGRTELVVRSVFGYTPASDHEADALGLALWWLQTGRMLVSAGIPEDALGRARRRVPRVRGWRRA